MKTKKYFFTVFVILFLSNCTTVNLGKYENTVYKTSKVETVSTDVQDNTEKLISTEYSYTLEQSPNSYDPKAKIKIVGEARYSYETQKKVKSGKVKKEFVKAVTILGAGAIAGGATLAFNDYRFGYLTMTSGLIAFTLSSILPKEVTNIEYVPGDLKYENKTVYPPQNTIVTIKSGEISKNYYTDSKAMIEFDIPNDFGYTSFVEKKDLTFEITMNYEKLKNKTTKKTYQSFSNDLWTDRLVKITDQDAKIYDSQNNLIKQPLIGTIYKVKPGYYYTNYEIELNNKTGFINKKYVTEMYEFDYKESNSDKEAIKMYVETKLEQWQQKGEFESTETWISRINNDRDAKVEEFTNEAFTKYQQELINDVNWSSVRILGNYDADNESFCIYINELDTIYLNVPNINDQAKNFKMNFDEFETQNPEFKIVNGNWKLFELSFFNPIDSISYKYLSTQSLAYDPNKEIDLKIKDLEILIKEEEEKEIVEESVIVDDNFDIESDIPVTNMDNSHSFAYLIGNKDYVNEDVKDVSFAENDVDIIEKYLIEVLGYKKENITKIVNATYLDMKKTFGSESKPGRIETDLKSNSNLFIYYSGHGAPAMDKKAYLAPVDAEVNDLELTGYSLNLLYDNIQNIETTGNITVIIDACFSGVEFSKYTSDLIFVPEQETVEKPNITIITASDADQPAHWYVLKQHGMFTYFFVKAMNDTENADLDKDGNLTYSEIFNYVNDIDNGLPYYTRRIFNGAKQNAVIQGGNKDGVFVKY